MHQDTPRESVFSIPAIRLSFFKTEHSKTSVRRLSRSDFQSCARCIYNFQFRELGTMRARWAWNESAFHMILRWARDLSQLDHFSLFIQGPLHTTHTYRYMLEDVKHIHTSMASHLPKLFVVRFPHPFMCPVQGDLYSRGVDEMLDDPSLPFRIIRPTSVFLGGELADLDTGLDIGWRQGMLFLPPNGTIDKPSEFVSRRYMVWAPMPSRVSWPGMI
jgi:hypothetical protein